MSRAACGRRWLKGTGILKTAKLCGCGVSIVQRIKAELAVPDAA